MNDTLKEARASVALDGDTVIIEPPTVEPELTADDVLATHQFTQVPTRSPARWGEPDNHTVYAERTEADRKDTLERYIQQRVKAACEAVRKRFSFSMHDGKGKNLPHERVWNAALDAAVERSVKGG
ncbi:MAG TPA: hypothetical protein VHO25_22055 [Polyangiaceae bacterium]|nr:hypothetical protein [Polyangiaceae bacterium]